MTRELRTQVVDWAFLADVSIRLNVQLSLSPGHYGLEHLTASGVVHETRLRVALAGSIFQLLGAAGRLLLSDFVFVASDHEVIALGIAFDSRMYFFSGVAEPTILDVVFR